MLAHAKIGLARSKRSANRGRESSMPRARPMARRAPAVAWHRQAKCTGKDRPRPTLSAGNLAAEIAGKSLKNRLVALNGGLASGGLLIEPWIDTLTLACGVRAQHLHQILQLLRPSGVKLEGEAGALDAPPQLLVLITELLNDASGTWANAREHRKDAAFFVCHVLFEGPAELIPDDVALTPVACRSASDELIELAVEEVVLLA